MNAPKFLYECWTFIKKMNQNSNITAGTLLSTLPKLPFLKSMHGTLFYRMVFDDKYNKFKPIFKQMDSTFSKKTQPKYLSFYVNRLKVLLKYGQPYEGTLTQLFPLLRSRVSRVDLIDLCNCLEILPKFRSDRFADFIKRIYELIEEELDKTVILDNVFLLSILRMASRSVYKTPQKLQAKLEQLQNGTLRYMEDKQILLLSNFMAPKSNDLLWERIKREEKPIYQRVLAKRYIKNIYSDTIEDALLPGRSPQTSHQIEEAISCVQSIMHKQSYLEIIPQELLREVEREKLRNIWSLYVNYLFYQIKKEYYRLPQQAVNRLVKNLFGMVTKDNAEDALRKTNLLKLYLILFDISRDVHATAPIKQQFVRVYAFIRAKVNETYLEKDQRIFEQFQFGQLHFMTHFLMYQAVLIIRGQQEEAMDIKIIKLIMKLRKEKYKNTNFQKLEQMINYISKGRMNVLKQTSIIAKNLTTKEQADKIIAILPTPFLDKINKSTSIYKNVIISPNIQLSHALISSTSQLMLGLDYDPLLNYNGNYIEQTSLFPLSSAWKSLFLEHINCSYFLPR